jgi:hypothetical protein
VKIGGLLFSGPRVMMVVQERSTMTDTIIRGAFLRAYADKKSETSRASWALIQDRDNNHRALNQAYGFVEKDGTVPIGCRSHVDLAYKAKYDAIEQRFKGVYDQSLPALYDWCRRQDMSIYECLWIDNVVEDTLTSAASLIVWQVRLADRLYSPQGQQFR